MRELKRLFLACLLLTFLGGLGVGAWIGTLTAAPRERSRSVDVRLADFREVFDLTPSQERQLRAVLYRHDRAVAEIRSELSARQRREVFEREEASREEIRAILTEDQRREYDRRSGHK